MSNVRNVLRTLRHQWELSQEDVALLLPRSSRDRVSRVERGLTSPNAEEILAYRLIFGCSVPKLFPRFYTETIDTVMQRAYRLNERLQKATSAMARRKRMLTQQMLERATRKAKRSRI